MKRKSNEQLLYDLTHQVPVNLRDRVFWSVYDTIEYASVRKEVITPMMNTVSGATLFSAIKVNEKLQESL